jgi:hypothetical protein
MAPTGTKYLAGLGRSPDSRVILTLLVTMCEYFFMIWPSASAARYLTQPHYLKKSPRSTDEVLCGGRTLSLGW